VSDQSKCALLRADAAIAEVVAEHATGLEKAEVLPHPVEWRLRIGRRAVACASNIKELITRGRNDLPDVKPKSRAEGRRRPERSCRSVSSYSKISIRNACGYAHSAGSAYSRHGPRACRRGARRFALEAGAYMASDIRSQRTTRSCWCTWRWPVASLSCCKFTAAQVPGGVQSTRRSPPRGSSVHCLRISSV
jgi:hypothetical protein